MSAVTILVGSWSDEWAQYRLSVTLELRVGDLGGDLAERGFQTTRHEPCPPGALTLSVTHDVRRRHGSSGKGVWREDAGGAGLPAEYVDLVAAAHQHPGSGFATTMTEATARRLVELADRWHLNTLRAGCAHQAPTVKRLLASGTPHRDLLDEVPPCPETGYRYGHAWLVEPLPDEILVELEAFGLTTPTKETA